MPDQITINGVTVKKGEHAQITLNIAKLPTHTVIDLPVFVFRSEVDGPVLLLTAGLHGDEINGIEIIRRMIWDKSITPDRGTVIAIPIVNIYGFIHTSRKFADGKDLNRSFPGSKNGSLASLIAYVLLNEIIPYIDVGIDFHTGGASKLNYPHIRSNLSRADNLHYAKSFAPPFIINSKPPDHSFRKAASLKGKPVLTFEGGESLRLHELSINEGTEGIGRLMHALKMKKTSVQTNETRILKHSWWNRAKYSGIFNSLVDIGETIKKKQVMGQIVDPFGESLTEVIANRAGYVIGINNMCVVNKGEALIHLAAAAGK